MDYALRINNLTKIYHLYDSSIDRLKETLSLTRKVYHRDFFALKSVSLDIKRGETVGVIGKNGAGKSTLLKIVTGVLSPSSGNVIVDGRVSALLELGAGFNPEYTGLENIYLSGTIMGYSRDEIDSRMDEILDFAEIGDFIGQPVKSYSSGMFMRLAFAVAINVDPDILIVDEALSVGDILFQAKCFKKFQEFKSRGKTILFVSHSLSSILQYCDRVAVMHHGELVAEGEPSSMVDLFKQILAMKDHEEVSIESIRTSASVPPEYMGEWKKHITVNTHPHNYGTRYAEIIDFGIFDRHGRLTNIVESGQSFSIKMRICFRKLVTDPIFAVTIKDVKGIDITGSNTLFGQIETGRFDAGTETIVTFEQSLDLPGDGYFISLGCTGYDNMEFVVYHRLYDIIPIQFINDRQVVGAFDMCSNISVKASSV